MTESGGITRPIIIDLGKRRRKRIKRLKRGRGRLMGEVYQAVDDVKASLGDDAEGKEFVPVVMIYRRKRRKRGGGWGIPFPFPPII